MLGLKTQCWASGDWKRAEQRFPSPSSAQSRFQMLKEDGITWERLEVSAQLKPQAWEQLPCAARLPRRRCLGAGMAVGCPRGTGPTWGVPSVPPCSSPCATTLIPSCHHTRPHASRPAPVPGATQGKHKGWTWPITGPWGQFPRQMRSPPPRFPSWGAPCRVPSPAACPAPGSQVALAAVRPY